MKNFLAFLLIILTAISCNQQEQPQDPDPVRRKSPIAIASITYQPTNTYVKIVYGQPYKRGRQIFGELESYDEVWRTGANEATELTTTKDIMFNDQRLEAGTYALFTIPRPNRWTVILNDSLGQWGAFDYNEKYDRLRTDVPSETEDQVSEALTLQFSEITNDSSSIVLRWDTTKVEIPISFIEADSIR